MKRLISAAIITSITIAHASAATATTATTATTGTTATTNIDGQVFVVTKGQNAIKLALVNVVAMDEKVLSAVYS